MVALFLAYLTDGRDISNQQKLSEVVAKAGMDRKRAQDTLNSDKGMDAIQEAGEQARRFRVDGMPFFIINSEITLSGAQSPDVFVAAFNQANGPS